MAKSKIRLIVEDIEIQVDAAIKTLKPCLKESGNVVITIAELNGAKLMIEQAYKELTKSETRSALLGENRRRSA